MDLATRFNGEIINGDAMQMYRGLPIITNQIPIEERNGIPHHLIDCIELEEEPWRVGIFRKECLRIIRDIHSRGKLPILVGGTHYYTQAVLFKDQIVGENNGEDEQGASEAEPTSSEDLSKKWPILDAPTEVVLQKLREVDPVMADRWHPNESRKIRRSLEIYFQTGRPASEIYAEQKRQRQAADSTGQLRFQTMVFWVHADRETLNPRLDARVDVMLQQGLMSEAKRMSDYIREKHSQGITVDSTKGVWVSIGFKELAPYFAAVYEGSSSEEELESLKRTCIESIKTATRQYGVSQVKWIRNKLWRALAEVGMTHCLFLLDSSKVEDWKTCITEPSELLVHSFLNNEPCPDPKSLSELARTTLEAKEAQFQKESSGLPKCITCEVCRRTMANEEQWNIHINGSAHRRAVKAAAKRAGQEEFLRKKESLENAQNSSSEK